jgi:hypothetical protein
MILDKKEELNDCFLNLSMQLPTETIINLAREQMSVVNGHARIS